MKIINLIFLLILAALQYRLWANDGIINEAQYLEKKTNAMRQKNEQLIERNLALTAEVLDLKYGKAAIEERARSSIGMIKNDETFYQIIDYSSSHNNH